MLILLESLRIVLPIDYIIWIILYLSSEKTIQSQLEILIPSAKQLTLVNN